MIQRLIRSLLIHVIYFPEYVHVLDGFILRCMTCVTVGFDSSTFGVKSSKTVTDCPDPHSGVVPLGFIVFTPPGCRTNYVSNGGPGHFKGGLLSRNWSTVVTFSLFAHRRTLPSVLSIFLLSTSKL